MQINLTPDQIDNIVKIQLLDGIKALESNILKNNQKDQTYIPMYSYDFDEESKYLKKLLKGMVKTYNYYSEVEYTNDLC
jgi:hypothetical protein